MYEHFTKTQQQFDVRRGDVYYINNNRGQRGNEIRININMRCIEIIAFYTLYRCHRAININMRCIEILQSAVARV